MGGCISRRRGEVFKSFHVRDGHGIKLLMRQRRHGGGGQRAPLRRP